MLRHGFMLGLGLITVGGKSKKKRPQETSPEAVLVKPLGGLREAGPHMQKWNAESGSMVSSSSSYRFSTLT